MLRGQINNYIRLQIARVVLKYYNMERGECNKKVTVRRVVRNCFTEEVICELEVIGCFKNTELCKDFK